jgi:hypothetical protein
MRPPIIYCLQKYGRTPFIRVNLEDQPSENAENPDLWNFCFEFKVCSSCGYGEELSSSINAENVLTSCKVY